MLMTFVGFFIVLVPMRCLIWISVILLSLRIILLGCVPVMTLPCLLVISSESRSQTLLTPPLG